MIRRIDCLFDLVEIQSDSCIKTKSLKQVCGYLLKAAYWSSFAAQEFKFSWINSSIAQVIIILSLLLSVTKHTVKCF